MALLTVTLAACQNPAPGPSDTPDRAAAKGDETAKVPEMTADEMMARAQELGIPGEGHARLEPMIGTFASTMTMWMEPGADPVISEGTSVNTWILGGRYLHQAYSADFMGGPFEGIATTAYNNATGKYQGTWLDTWSTHMWPPSEGEWNEADRSITSWRTYDDHVTGLPVTTRDVVRIVSDDEHHFEMFETRGGGDEVKVFTIAYTRKD